MAQSARDGRFPIGVPRRFHEFHGGVALRSRGFERIEQARSRSWQAYRIVAAVHDVNPVVLDGPNFIEQLASAQEALALFAS